MSEIDFFIPMKHPPTHTYQSGKRVGINKEGKPFFYEDEKLKALRSYIKGYLFRYKPEKPIEKPIVLSSSWCYETEGTERVEPEPKITKPDTDNLVKLLKDCMTEIGFWKDDALVWKEETQKVWYFASGVHVSVKYDE